MKRESIRFQAWEYCQIDGHPLVRAHPTNDVRHFLTDGDRLENNGDARKKCLNEQTTHYYVWPDKERNSGWILILE